MSKIHIYIVLFSIICFFTRCNYIPDSDFINEIQPQETKPELSINLSDIQDNDTLAIRINEIELLIDTDPTPETLRLNSFQVIINNDTVTEKNRIPDQITFKTYHLDSGLNSVIVRFNNSTQTGSIADTYGLENNTYEKQFYIDKIIYPNHIMAYVGHSIVDGYLKVNYNQYPYAGFNYYRVIRQQNMIYDTIVSKEQNRNTDYFIDSSFIETTQNNNYYISSFANNNHIDQILVNLNYNLPHLKGTAEGTDVNISWNKTKFFNNLQKYEIRTTDNSFHLNEEPFTFESENVNDTSIIISDFPFGTSVKFEYRFLPKGKEYINWRSASYNLGEYLPTEYNYSSTNAYSPDLNKVLYLKNNHIEEESKYGIFDLEQMALTETIELSEFFSDEFCSLNGTTIGAFNNKKATIIDLNSLTVKTTLSLVDLLNGYYPAEKTQFLDIDKVLADDVGNVYFFFRISGYPFLLYKYNLNNSSLTQISIPEQITYNYEYLQVNATGDYFIFRNELYAVQDNNFELLKEAVNPHFIKDTDYCLFQEDKRIIIYDCKNRQTLTSYSFDGYFSTLSTDSRFFITSSGFEKSVVDIFTGEKLFTFKCNYTRGTYYTIKGDYIYLDDNLRLKTDISVSD